MVLVLVIMVGLLAGCGGDDTLEPAPVQGSLADYFPLEPGNSFLFQQDGDPQKSAVLTVKALQDGGSLYEVVSSDPEQPRIAVAAVRQGESFEVYRFERGAVRILFDPPLRALAFPLREGDAFSGTTRIEFLGRRLGVSMFGVVGAYAERKVLGTSYPDSFSLTLNLQTDLLGRSRVDLVLAKGVGIASLSVVSPAVEALGFDGVELKLERLS